MDQSDLGQTKKTTKNDVGTDEITFRQIDKTPKKATAKFRVEDEAPIKRKSGFCSLSCCYIH